MDFIAQSLAKLARLHNWTVIDWQEKIKMISFANAVGQECRINVYTSTMTAGVVFPDLKNPTGRRKQEFVYDLTYKDLGKLFAGIAPAGCYKGRAALRVPLPGRKS